MMDDHPPFEAKPVRRLSGRDWSDQSLNLVWEVPVAMVYNGISHAVMMATPIALEDFAVGFSLTEGIVESLRELTDVEVAETANGIEVRMTIFERRMAGLKERRRNMTGRTGCGLCGTESLDYAIRPLPPLVDSMARFQPIQVLDLLPAMDQAQELRRATRASHGAAWIDAQGRVLAREDVGRHNALDKVIGAGYRSKWQPERSMAVVSSRCSVEMVQKVVAARIPLLAAVASPTALAVKLADEWGLTLVTSLRPDSFDVATHPHRIEGAA